MLPHNKQGKQQIEQCTCINKPVNTEILIQKYNVNLSSKGNNVTVEKKEKEKQSLKLTRIVHHIQPICHSIHEQNPTRA